MARQLCGPVVGERDPDARRRQLLTDDRGRGVTRLANCVGETASTPRLGPATGGSSGCECGRATADDSWPHANSSSFISSFMDEMLEELTATISGQLAM